MVEPLSKRRELVVHRSGGNGARGVRWSYFAFSNAKVRGQVQTTIQRWYDIEMKKISASQQLLALLDDPEATEH